MAASKRPIRFQQHRTAAGQAYQSLCRLQLSASSLQNAIANPRAQISDSFGLTNTTSQCVTSAGRGDALFRKYRRFIFVAQVSSVPRGRSRCTLSSFRLGYSATWRFITHILRTLHQSTQSILSVQNFWQKTMFGP